MNRNQSSTTLEPVEFLNLYNYYSAPQGLIRAGVASSKDIHPSEVAFATGTSLVGGGHLSLPFLGFPAITSTRPTVGYLTTQTMETYPEIFGNYEDMVNTEFNSGEKRTFLFSDNHIFTLNGNLIELVSAWGGNNGSYWSDIFPRAERITPVEPNSTRVRISTWYYPTPGAEPVHILSGYDPTLQAGDTVIFECRLDGLNLGYASVDDIPGGYLDSNGVFTGPFMGRQYAAAFVEYQEEVVGDPGTYRYIVMDFFHDPPPFDQYATEILDLQFFDTYKVHSKTYDYLQFNDTFFFTEKNDIPTKTFGIVSGRAGFIDFDWKVGSTLNLRGFAAMATHRERIIVGNTLEDETGVPTRYPMRIRWTQPYDKTVIEDTAFYDFNEYGDEIIEIVPFMDTIWVFMRNCVYIGRIAGIPNLPYVFTKLPTAGVGIASRRAVSVIDNNIIFIGKDDVYRYSTDEGLVRIGTKIFNYLKLDQSNNMGKSAIAHIPERQTVAVLFRSDKDSTPLGQLWAYNLITNAWSILLDEVGGIAYAGFTKSLVYDSTTETYDDVVGITYNDIVDEIFDRGLVIFRGSGIFAYYNQKTRANIDSIFDDTQVLETGDLSFGLPNVEKIATRLSISLADTYENAVDGLPLEFSLHVSNDRGQSWKNCGTLRIPIGKNEGKVDFRATGSTLRFRLSTNRVNTPYTIIEYALRVRTRGIEVLYK